MGAAPGKEATARPPATETRAAPELASRPWLSSPAESPPQHKCTKPAGILPAGFCHVRRRRGLGVVTAAAFLVELLKYAATVVKPFGLASLPIGVISNDKGDTLLRRGLLSGHGFG